MGEPSLDQLTDNPRDYVIAEFRLLESSAAIQLHGNASRNPDCILELHGIVAMIMRPSQRSIESISVNGAGSFGADVALRLGRDEIQRFREIRIAVQGGETSIRAIARDVSARPGRLGNDLT